MNSFGQQTNGEIMTTIGQVHKVTALPALAALAPNALYYVESATSTDIAEIYITGDTPTGGGQLVVRRTLLESDVDAKIVAALDSNGSFRIVDDIAARDALGASLERDTLVKVIDASAAPDVEAGSANYAFQVATGTFTKTSEGESLDIELTWDALIDGPASSPAQVDAAVAAAHTHANATILDGLGEDADGNLQYNGDHPSIAWDSVGW